MVIAPIPSIIVTVTIAIAILIAITQLPWHMLLLYQYITLLIWPMLPPDTELMAFTSFIQCHSKEPNSPAIKRNEEVPADGEARSPQESGPMGFVLTTESHSDQ